MPLSRCSLMQGLTKNNNNNIFSFHLFHFLKTIVAFLDILKEVSGFSSEKFLLISNLIIKGTFIHGDIDGLVTIR